MSMQLDRKLSGVDFDGARKSIDKLIASSILEAQPNSRGA